MGLHYSPDRNASATEATRQVRSGTPPPAQGLTCVERGAVRLDWNRAPDPSGRAGAWRTGSMARPHKSLNQRGFAAHAGKESGYRVQGIEVQDLSAQQAHENPSEVVTLDFPDRPTEARIVCSDPCGYHLMRATVTARYQGKSASFSINCRFG